MAKNTDTSIKLLVLYDILCKMTDEDHVLSTNELIDELAKRGIAVSRKVLPSDIVLLNKYGYEVCSYTKKARYYYAEHPNQSRKSYHSGDRERYELRGIYRI